MWDIFILNYKKTRVTNISYIVMFRSIAFIKSTALLAKLLDSSLNPSLSIATARAFPQNFHRSKPWIGPLKSGPCFLLFLSPSPIRVLGNWTIRTKRLCPQYNIQNADALIRQFWSWTRPPSLSTSSRRVKIANKSSSTKWLSVKRARKELKLMYFEYWSATEPSKFAGFS